MKIWINHKRIIQKVDHSWDDIAKKNNAIPLCGNQLSGTNLLSGITGDSARMFLDAIISRVLVTGTPYILHYRCDSPSKAQFMRMIVRRNEDHLIEIEHDLLDRKAISPAILFTEDETAHEKRCLVCGKVEFKREWYDAQTHRRVFGTLKTLATQSTVCPTCELEEEKFA